MKKDIAVLMEKWKNNGENYFYRNKCRQMILICQGDVIRLKILVL